MNILYEDNDVLAVDKPAGIAVFPEGNITETTLIDGLIEKYPELRGAGEAPRYGVAHRLDKDTSGVLLVAKTDQALIFLQNQFTNRRVEKKYTALVTGVIKKDSGIIHTLIGRSPQDPRKQKVYLLEDTGLGRREAITEFTVLQRFAEYTLVEAAIKTGRKHQIRAHFAYIHHPIAGDKKYGFKDSPIPAGLSRQFLHASYLQCELPGGKVTEFQSSLPKDLQGIIDQLFKSHFHDNEN